jgi:hypothetical protein
MLPYISVTADVLASIALVVSVVFLLKELRLTRDSIRHSDFVNSVNRSAENMLRITENEELLTTIEKISAYRNQPLRNRSQLRRIIDALTPQERVRYFHFQRNACLSCEVFLDSAAAGFIDQDRFSMAFGWNDVDYEIWEALGLTIGPKTRQRFAKVPRQIVPLQPISAG